jgi:hypothetical protein
MPRYIISIPYYADSIEEVEKAMDLIAEKIEVPYISLSIKNEGTTFVTDKEYLT